MLRCDYLSRVLLAVAMGGFAWASPRAQSVAESPLVVTGALVDQGGSPVAGVDVVLRPYPSQHQVDLDLLGFSNALPEAVDRRRSRPDGAFSLTAPLPGPYRLEIHPLPPPGQPDVELPSLYQDLAPLLEDRSLEPLELPQRRPAAIRVLDVDDRPVQGARVVVSLWAGYREGESAGSSAAERRRIDLGFHRAASTTNGDGIARFLMPRSSAQVVVSAPGFVVGRATADSRETTVRLERSTGFRFRVVDPSGQPAPWVVVRAAAGFRTPLAVTDESGTATVGRLADGAKGYEFERADQALAWARSPTRKAAEPAGLVPILGVQLDAPLRILGRALDASTGRPVENAAVWSRGAPGHNAISGPRGAFELTTRPWRGALAFQAVAPGYLLAEVDAESLERTTASEVAVALTPVVTLAGQVMDAGGQPLADARIHAEPDAGTWPARRPPQGTQLTTSSGDGSFRFRRILPRTAYRLMVRASGFPAKLVEVPPIDPGAETRQLLVTLTGGSGAWGRVTDTEGNPVAKAEVTLHWPTAARRSEHRRSIPTDTATTDEQGRFRFSALGAGRYEVALAHAEYVGTGDSTAEVKAGEEESYLGEFTLLAGAKLHGRVIDSRGGPVASATITALGSGAEAPERTAISDTEGQFRLSGLSHDLVRLRVRADGHPPLAVFTRPGADEPLVIELSAGALLTGRVTDDASAPVAAASVWLLPDLENQGRTVAWDSRDHATQTNGEGRFRFEHVAPGKWSLDVRSGQSRGSVDGIHLQEGAEREVDLRLRKRSDLTITVTDESNRPVADASIRVTYAGRPLATVLGSTDASGRARIAVDVGVAAVHVAHRQYREKSTSVELVPGVNDLAVRLLAGGTIRGYVRSADHAPLSRATVLAQTDASLDLPAFARRFLGVAAEAETDAEGRFEIAGLEPGRYVVSARAVGFAANAVERAIEIAGQSTAVVDIVLTPGGSITGIVTGLPPSRLVDVEISATRFAERETTSPDHAGAFALSNLALGEWTITATSGDLAGPRTVRRAVTIRDAVESVFVELPFERGFRFSGQVLASGKPLVGGLLSVRRTGSEEVRATMTDHRGRFAMEGLPLGGYELTIRRTMGAIDQRLIDLSGDLQGLTIDLQPPATLAGVVIDAVTGEAIVDANLTVGDPATLARPPEDGSAFSPAIAGFTLSTAGGRFELDVGPNASHLLVSRRGYANALLPLGVLPGQRLTGLLVELQPKPPISPGK